MKRILLTISFNGTNYHGWQIQPNALTVQEVLQACLFKVLGKETPVSGCSRTDAGVHAKMFCCHLGCDDNVPKEAFLRGLNSVLPKDIAVLSCKEVENDFHARFDSKGKTYVYNILNSNQKDPFLLPFYWQIERELNTDLMNEFCKTLIGKHDFSAFSSTGRTVENTVREIKECFVTRDNNKIQLTVTADGFLYNMVRIIVGTAVEVSFEKLPVSCGLEAFKTKCRESLGITAPAQGLFLDKVYYNF